MATKNPEFDAVLAIDVGSVHTRAYLFEIAGDSYRFIAQGVARTTAEYPVHDIGEGIVFAIQQLEEITGHQVLGPDGRFIIPSLPGGQGVDALTATLSAGPTIKVVCAGLLGDVSVISAEHLAKTGYTRILDRVSINDARSMDEQIDAILHIMPDAIILAGGTEDGARRAMRRVLTTLGLSCSLLPPEKRPEVLFTGNQFIRGDIKGVLEASVPLTIAPNIRPQPEIEVLDPAQAAFVEIMERLRFRQVMGAADLNNLVGGRLMPTASSFGRMIRFLGKIYQSPRGVLGIDMGASQTTIALAKGGRLNLRVCQPGSDKLNPLEAMYQIPIQDLLGWIGYNLSEEYIRDYLVNKVIYPATIPTTQEDLAIEYSFARYRLRNAVSQFAASYPGLNFGYRNGLAPGFEPILISGTTLTSTPTLASSLLMILDGLQPTGLTTIVLDQNHLLPVLGSAGSLTPALPVEVLETGMLFNLCALIAPISQKRPGTTIMTIHVITEDQQEIDMEVQQGTLTVIPLAQGESAQLFIDIHEKDQSGLSGSKSGGYKVTAGALGIVIDARGRPLNMPTEIVARQEILRQWMTILGN